TVNPRVSADDIAATDATICEGESIELSTLVSGDGAGEFFRVETDAGLTDEAVSTTGSLPVTTTYYVTVSGTGVCENAPGTAAERSEERRVGTACRPRRATDEGHNDSGPTGRSTLMSCDMAGGEDG